VLSLGATTASTSVRDTANHGGLQLDNVETAVSEPRHTAGRIERNVVIDQAGDHGSR